MFGLRWGGSFLVGDTVWWLSNRRCGGSVIEDLVAHGEKSMVDHNWRCVDPLAEMCWLIGRKIWWRIVGFVVWWRVAHCWRCRLVEMWWLIGSAPDFCGFESGVSHNVSGTLQGRCAILSLFALL